ncbi:MAG: hypothetical protein J1F66_01775 [Clostridiales bacterium]|nr:hypothetical protein [Clostridiales bacterium]
MLTSAHSGVVFARHEYDALGNCTILENIDGVAEKNPFRWKGFYFDSETGFYYANGSYYDPETALYVDAAQVSTVIDNALSPRHIDRNGMLCYNPLALAGSPFTAFPTMEMEADETYDPGQTWWDNLWEKSCNWWQNIPKWIKFGIGLAVIVGLAIATIATGGASGVLWGAVCAGALKGALIGATSGAIVSGTIEGLVSLSNHQRFWDGFANGAADRFMFGAITGAITGAIEGANGWYNAKASYPPNNGAVPGTEQEIVLQPGKYSRYGTIGPKSDYITAAGASPSQLSLPPWNDIGG